MWIIKQFLRFSSQENASLRDVEDFFFSFALVVTDHTRTGNVARIKHHITTWEITGFAFDLSRNGNNNCRSRKKKIVHNFSGKNNVDRFIVPLFCIVTYAT